MGELDRLSACIEDGRALMAVKTQDELRAFFESSKTNISDAFDGGVDGVLSRWKGHDLDDIRAYLLWDYIAYNIAELYNSYDLARQVLEKGLEESGKS